MNHYGRSLQTHGLGGVTLIGAPTDVGAGDHGGSMGPLALRVAGLGRALAAMGIAVHDGGDLQGPYSLDGPMVNGMRNLAAVVEWSQKAHEAVLSALQAKRLPILLGGDHSLAIGSVSAVARYCYSSNKKLRILWLDAHSDLNTDQVSSTGNIHGMPLASLCGYGVDELTAIGGVTPAVLPAEVRQIGLRSVDDAEKEIIQRLGLEVYDMRCIDEMGMRQCMEMALAGMDNSTHLHVSFDVDFLDPLIAPGVATTVAGGPNYREAQLCMEMIADTGLLGSLDIVELNPALDIRNQTARVVVDMVASLFGKSTLIRG